MATVTSVAEAALPSRAVAGPRRRWITGLLLVIAVFGLYGVTTSSFVGYDDETAAVAEGLVNAGQLRVQPGTPLTTQGVLGRGGYKYSRTGLTQPLLEAPFYYVGKKLDEATSDARNYKWRDVLLWLYEPFVAALTVGAIYALLLLRGVSERRAAVTALLCAVATLIWPYSKIGMDTTLLAMVALTLTAGAWAAARPSARRFGLLGAVAGAAAATKPYGGLIVVGVVPLLYAPFMSLPRSKKLRLAVALLAPVLLWAVAIAWYNWYRTGLITNFSDPPAWAPLSTPINAIGLFVSPGKGLLLYSPLAIVGLFGMRTVSSADRRLAATIVAVVAINTLVIAPSAYWSDETWGPRYLIPSAWLLVIPIAWWGVGRRRLRIVAAVTAVAVYIQISAVLIAYTISIGAADALAGGPVFAPGSNIPYGNDGPRWVPQDSALLFNVEFLTAYIKEQLTGTGFVVHYDPYRGHAASIDLDHPDQFTHVPDFWWSYPGTTTMESVVAACLGCCALGGGVLLVRRSIPRTPRGPVTAAA